MNECQNTYLVLGFEHLIEHSIALEHKKFTDALIVLFRNDPAPIRELSE
jgi:hypothetical protein